MATRTQLPYPLPAGYDFLCMNLGNWFTDDPADTADIYERNGREIYGLGIRKIRMGGTSPLYTPEAEFSTIADQVEIYKNIGFTHVEMGTTHLNGVDPQLTASNWDDYHDYAVSFATALYAAGLDAFMMGNEMIGSHYDNTTLTLDDLYSNFVQLATDIHDVCPDLLLVYNGTSNEMATWTTWIGTHGAIPAYMKLGFNLYGSGPSDVATFKTQVDDVVALDGYVSEWAQYYDWANVPLDEELQYSIVAARLEVLRKVDIDAYYWTWKYYNKNAASEWNFWALKKSNANPASPQVFDTSFYTRAAYYALFADRRPTNRMNQAVIFDGSASYGETGITPASTGISLGFWYNRQRFFASNDETIISNITPVDSYVNGFRLYNDAASKNLVLQVGSATETNNFKVVATQPTGTWTHIAITINSSGANLYINGVVQGSALPGDIGTPSRAIIIGARPIDFAIGGQFFMSNLTIENTSTAWTQQEITDLITSNTIPTGASQWSFNRKNTDQNGANPITLTGTSWAYGAPSPERVAAGNRFQLPSTTQKSLVTNGISDYATVPFVPSTSGFSLGLWFNKSALGNNEKLIDCTNASNQNGFRINFSAGANNKITFVLMDNGGSGTVSINTGNMNFVNKWNFLVFTFKPNEAKFFLNGVQVGATDTSCSMGTPTTLTLARSSGVSSEFFKGNFYRLTIQNTATPWTQTQINDLYYRNIIPTGASQWSMNNTNLDQSGANGLTITGTTYAENAPLQPRTQV